MNESVSENKRLNRLAGEKSPYLLQHATNPVDWFPWGEEAFAKAEKEDKPVFLSIGYSTCHWCHVMEKESFEDPEVARLINESLVPVKVDREERPDLDSIYMNAAQMLSGGGGWPLSIFLTPNKRPFFAATYIPKDARMGMIGMTELVPRIKELWDNDRQKIDNVAGQVIEELNRPAGVCGGEAPGADLLDMAYQQLAGNFDNQYGGVGQRPKFPSPHNFYFLLRYYKRTGEKLALHMVDKTLTAMRHGGIYDHVGFGFHRYSTDREWLVPHFEKMLYDQALLAIAYTEAFQETGKNLFDKTVREIITYVLRDMTSPEGGFYSAEDADSEGEEGKFYTWTMEEVRQVLDEEEAVLAYRVFELDDHGNFRDEASGMRTGKNIFHLGRDLAKTAKDLSMTEAELEEKIDSIRRNLFEAREGRVHPHKDDKVLADWNGLMIAAMARAGAVLDEPEYITAARRAADFVRERMIGDDGRLFHRFRDEEAAIPAFFEDYAYMAWGMVELYEACFDATYLERAVELVNYMQKNFRHAEVGGFFQTEEQSEDTISRPKDAFDGALPSGNSVAMMVLLRLSGILADPSLEKEAEEIMNAFYCTTRKAPAAFSMMMSAFDYALGPSSEVVIVGDREAEDTGKLLAALNEKFLPNKVAVLKEPGKDNRRLERLADYVTDMDTEDGKAAAYVCRGHSCERPVTSADEMVRLLKSLR